MLVENKFIYISLPRSASTSFMASCVQQKLNMKHLIDEYNIEKQIKRWGYDINNIDFEQFEKFFDHVHEPVNLLREKFGFSYDVISVRRNKYERFVSLWKHILRMLEFKEDMDTLKKCSNLTMNEILSHTTNDLQTFESIQDYIEIFVKRHKLNNITDYGKQMLKTFFSPYSKLHLHDSKIIWFDFNELNKLEDWVSEKLNVKFKLIQMNSSQYMECNLVLNDEFKEKYDSIYYYYDEIKNMKTLF